jgi:hypothetical protein
VGVGGKKNENMKWVVNRSLDFKHAWMGTSLEKLCHKR